ncbi:spore germination protein [Bacillus sp. JCM 19041]|uniref:spore germination protein n=1 Tax=Bacillus sp. JCM 19041 TaxID=1460637 RepID=UPI0009E9EFCE
MLTGSLLLRFVAGGKQIDLLVELSYQEDREITVPEIEFSVFGSKESFIETVEVNINLLRRRIPSTDLYMKKYTIGSGSKTSVYVVYCQSIANAENVQTVKQRITDLQLDQVPDSSTLLQVLEDSSSVFPQIIDTERPDRTASALMEGKIAVLTDGSPQALIAPVTIFEFISAFEDYFLSWQTASMLRIIRICAIVFSIFATPLYVAILSYHPEIIPQDLFATLVASRTAVPFPPILEALFLEVTIELLREAGARLPTKVGQTIGIVGGIVIGTAAVEAGLTSNILLIIVALAALASFTIPVYRMGTTIRIVRFPFIVAAQVWGLIAIALLFVFITCHLLSLKSLGRPYTEPIYPFSFKDMKDSLIRLPISSQEERPDFLQTKNPLRFIAKNKKKNTKPDIDDGY